MFETTGQFFSDTINCLLPNEKMTGILHSLTDLDDVYTLAQAMYEFHQLKPAERNYICCVLFERDQNRVAWQTEWDRLSEEAFE